MGKVYLAQQASLGRPVALKLIERQLWNDERGRQRFRREAELAAAIDSTLLLHVARRLATTNRTVQGLMR